MLKRLCTCVCAICDVYIHTSVCSVYAVYVLCISALSVCRLCALHYHRVQVLSIVRVCACMCVCAHRG